MSSRFDSDIKAALKASALYCRYGNINDLNKSIEIWERILSDPHFINEDRELRLTVLNDSAGVYLFRYQARGKLDDLTRAINFSTTVVVTALPDSPNMARYINNLGIGLKINYVRTGNLSDLEQCISAFNQSVDLTHNKTDNLSELPIYLNNLGDSLMLRYDKTCHASDLEQAVNDYQDAVDIIRKNALNPPELPLYTEKLEKARNLLNGLNKSEPIVS